MKLSNKIYDILKWIALIGIPSISTLYIALSTIWRLPYAEQIIGTLSAIGVFIGATLQISNVNYKKGDK